MMDQEIRNKLRNVVTQCRKLLEDSVSQELEGKYGIFAKKDKKDQVTADPNAKMTHLTEEEQAARKDILDHFGHIQARGFKPDDSLDQLIREVAFTHLNRLCAYKMMEAREVYVGGQKFREAVSRGVNSNGVKFYLADHEEEERLFNTGQQDVAYRHYLDWLGGQLSGEIGVLFNPNDPANRLYPRQKTLDEVLELLNDGGINAAETELREQWPQIWSQDETIGWVYQYFTPKELRDKARKESQAPRNSYELAFRNQFFTPRYVVEFLTDNTLGRIWYEMQKGETKLKDQCRYMVRRPTEIFLQDPNHFGSSDNKCEWTNAAYSGDFSKLPKNPSWDEIQKLALVIDGYKLCPQIGLGDCAEFANARMEKFQRTGEWSGNSAELWISLFYEQRRWRHFGQQPEGDDLRVIQALYSDLCSSLTDLSNDRSQEELLRLPVYIPHRPKKDPRELKILDPACGSGHFLLYCFDLLLTIYEEAYADPDLSPALKNDYPTIDALKRDMPRLILAHNLHGIDIDLRASQIAALALWLRCQRAYQDMGFKKDRPKITRSNFVCAEPMPGEEAMLKEFVSQLEPKVLGQVVEVVFDKMKLAGEAGSLLKIEEEIRDAIREAKRQYAIGGISVQRTLFDKPTNPVVKVFSVKDITDAQFFEGAEVQVIEALRSYAEKAQNGQRLQRRLFTEDAVRGFAYVDLCQKRYDVLLMNPPFGDATELHSDCLRSQYPTSRFDLGACFVECGMERLLIGGRLGAITSRSLYFLGRFEDFRRTSLLAQSSVRAFADLGLGVLDAFIDTSLIILEHTLPNDLPSAITCFDAKHCDTKSDALREQITLFWHRDLCTHKHSFVVSASHFHRSPLAAFSFWSSSGILSLLDEVNSLAAHGVDTCVGLQTDDDARFLRLTWEVNSSDVTNDWKYLAKGGEYSKFWDDIHLVINWRNSGKEVKAFVASLFGSASKHVQNERHYFRPGLTYPFRTAKGFNIRCLPKGCVFTLQGMAVFAPDDDPNELIRLLGILNSHFILHFLKMLTSADAYQVGYVRRLPCVVRDLQAEETIREVVNAAIESRQSLDALDETCRLFQCPVAVAADAATLSDALNWAIERLCKVQFTITCAIDKINGVLATAWFSEEDEAKQILNRYSEPPLEWSLGTPSRVVGDCISWAVGIAYGRWNGQFRHTHSAVNNDPFAALRRCSPGMLQDAHDLPTEVTASGYPFSVQWDGILSDEPNESNDILKKVKDVIEVIWKDGADAIEKEACEILGVKELRDYFRKPGKGGFWDDHISRYSKSRRKAPIYWLLQSSKKNYALWVYYHRLDKDLLFKALVNYVEPKIRLEISRLESLHSQKAAAGESGKEAKRFAKDVERQEDFLSELRDFEDKLRRAANLHLEPDLNDGVVLNIAPLWELVPWKEAKKYWDELLEGQYEWSSIGKQLRQKGLVK